MNKKIDVPYGRGLAQGYRGLGPVRSGLYDVSKDRWDEIFGKKEKDETVIPCVQRNTTEKQ